MFDAFLMGSAMPFVECLATSRFPRSAVPTATPSAATRPAPAVATATGVAPGLTRGECRDQCASSEFQRYRTGPRCRGRGESVVDPGATSFAGDPARFAEHLEML